LGDAVWAPGCLGAGTGNIGSYHSSFYFIKALLNQSKY